MKALLDHRGRPIRKPELRREVAPPTTTGVRTIHTTHPASGLTPARLGALLRDAEAPGGAERYLELAEEMEERNPHYLGVLQTRRRQVSQIPVEVSPAADDSAAVDVADQTREALFGRAAWEDEAFDVLDSIGKGFSVTEIVWDMSERQWRPARLEHRLPQWFDFDRETGARLTRRDGAEWVELEPWKFVVHRSAAKSGLPIRGGIARVVAWCWMYASFGVKDWARYVEAYGMPLRLGRYHDEATNEEIAVLRRAVRDIGADAAAVVPESMAVEFVTETPGRAGVFAEHMAYLDKQITIAVLGQTLTTDTSGAGSYALGQVHDMVRKDIERSDGRQLAATLSRDLVAPFVALNFGPDVPLPRLSILRPDPTDVAQLSQALERLVPLGLRVDADEVRRKLGLGAPPKDGEALAPPPASSSLSAARALLAAARADGDGVDLATLRALDDWRPMLDPLAGAALAAAADELERGGGLAALRDRLPALLDGMDESALADALERLAFSARLAGRADP